MRRFFRKPAVRRCRKVPSKTFKSVHPSHYQEMLDYGKKGDFPEWEGTQNDSFQLNPSMEASQPVQKSGVGSRGKQQEGYFPGDRRPATSNPRAFYSTTSMSSISECFTDDSRYSAREGTCRSAFPNPNSMRMERLSAGGKGANESSAHSELMFMIDQLEQAELEKIQRDLRQFQTSRRRLMFNLSSLSATSAPPARLMKPVTAAANLSIGCGAHIR